MAAPPVPPAAAAAPATANRPRRPPRRDLILEAAARLFHEHGYHKTGIDEIGEAAGITGPGVYRHFRSKEHILELLVRRSGDALLAEVRGIVEASPSPNATIEALIDRYVDGVAANPSVAMVAVFERRTLSGRTRSWVDRNERLVVEEFAHALSVLQPGVSDAELRLQVRAVMSSVLGVINSRHGLDDHALRSLLKDMMRHGLAVASAPPTRRKGRVADR